MQLTRKMSSHRYMHLESSPLLLPHPSGVCPLGLSHFKPFATPLLLSDLDKYIGSKLVEKHIMLSLLAISSLHTNLRVAAGPVFATSCTTQGPALKVRYSPLLARKCHRYPILLTPNCGRKRMPPISTPHAPGANCITSDEQDFQRLDSGSWMVGVSGFLSSTSDRRVTQVRRLMRLRRLQSLRA